MDADRRLTFDGFSLDLANEQLVCDGEVVALTPKAFAVLRRLVEDNGKLVTKAELLQAGWADTHVTDGVLTSARRRSGQFARQAGVVNARAGDTPASAAPTTTARHSVRPL